LSAAESTRPVLVVDLCGERGAVARLLGVEPHLRWITVGADHGGPTTLLDSVSIGPGGVRLATAMFDDEAPPATSARHVRSLCHTLRVLFDVVIIDVPRTADALLPTVLAGADDVLIVSSMSSLGAHATRRLIGVINSAGTVQGQRTVVLNRTEANNDLDR